jgi:DNA-binding MarR family transcriptional regulator
MTDSWDLRGFVISSRYRKLVIHELIEGPTTPSRLAERSDASIASISHALSELREKDCVELLVDEDRRKGRVYGLTETGTALFEDLEEQQLM